MGKKFFLVVIMLYFFINGNAQPISNARQHYISTKSDTVSIDSLSLIPQTFFLMNDSGIIINTASYTIDYSNALLIWNKNSILFSEIKTDSIKAIYRVFPVLFTQRLTHKEKRIIEQNYSGLYNPFEYKENQRNTEVFKMEGLTKNGSISRGVSFGNNQDVVVNSSLNLQLAGKLNDEVEILAAITDNNIPVQPEGNTQQLNDFDKVFIQLSKNKTKLIAGDFDLTRPNSYFMNFNKKGQGGVFATEFNFNQLKTSPVMRAAASAAVSKGKFARNVFNGLEANQGPYKLHGADNESYIVILSGSEKIFIDGVQMTRGQEYDYVIDYNTAEIIFTTKQLITKDKRIVAEFQYSDKNYARSLIYLNDELDIQKFRLRMNIYSEQDSKNQPLLQDLSDDEKKLLADVGDSLQNALTPNIDSVAFNASEVLYAKIDSAGYVFYRYSTDSTIAHFRLGFSNVGMNIGNYIQVNSSANGRVFQWLVPLNGIPQGQYEPVTLLISPKQQQMVTFGGDYLLSENSKITVEGALSNYDINLFSKKDKSNDAGYAASAGYQQTFGLQADKKNGWKLNTGFKFEHIDKQFVPIETFRNTEFTRDWNLTNLVINENENSGSLLLGLNKQNQQSINYQLKTFLKGSQYHGYMNALNGVVNYNTFRLAFNGSYLTTSGTLSKTNFLRSNTDLSSRLLRGEKIIIGARYEQERNKIFDLIADTMQQNSFSYQQGQFYLATSDTLKTRFKTDYSRRYDYAVRNNAFKNTTVADNASASLEFNKNPNNRLALSATYRELRIIDTLLTAQKKENSLLNRVEYNLQLFKGAVVSTTYYEAGTGQELKREFSYVKVTDGTGVYTFNDYNGDGIPQLNEFEIAAFQDQANYIRVFTPTNEFIKTHTNRLNQVFNLNPIAAVDREKRFGKFLSLFADQFSMRVENKTLEEDLMKSLNPFLETVSDSTLISTASSYRNTFFINRSGDLGIDITYEANRNKSLLVNGFESRILNEWNSNIRWNLSHTLSINLFGENGKKQNKSDYFSTRDFLIDYYSTEGKFNIQPGARFRTSLVYEFKFKKNTLSDLHEKSEQHKTGVEMRYSSVKRGIISGKIDFIQINYNAEENTSIAYEILEGLKKGKNITWNVSLQRNLSGNVQMSLNYEGRKSENIKPIHTGGVQVRAYF
ncbi:MAG: hypothetical protein ACHQNT_13035 [Bacteroidia bacterium]